MRTARGQYRHPCYDQEPAMSCLYIRRPLDGAMHAQLIRQLFRTRSDRQQPIALTDKAQERGIEANPTREGDNA
jgi:hypothetical protein